MLVQAFPNQKQYKPGGIDIKLDNYCASSEWIFLNDTQHREVDHNVSIWAKIAPNYMHVDTVQFYRFMGRWDDCSYVVVFFWRLPCLYCNTDITANNNNFHCRKKKQNYKMFKAKNVFTTSTPRRSSSCLREEDKTR